MTRYGWLALAAVVGAGLSLAQDEERERTVRLNQLR